ncbi:hypothetical protein AAG906_031814 [Vitis piasezkii]
MLLLSPQVVHQWFFLCSLGTTLVALRYYLSGLCTTLRSSSGPPMVFCYCSLGTTLMAFSPQVVHQWFLLCSLGTTLMAFSPQVVHQWFLLCFLGTTLMAFRYYLSGLEPVLTLQLPSRPICEYDSWINNIGVDGLFTYFTGDLHDFREWTSSLSR